MGEQLKEEPWICNCPVGVETAIEAIYRNRKTVYLSIAVRCRRCKARLEGYGDVNEFDTIGAAKEFVETLEIGAWESWEVVPVGVAVKEAWAGGDKLLFC